jgi:hypothetical protein
MFLIINYYKASQTISDTLCRPKTSKNTIFLLKKR